MASKRGLHSHILYRIRQFEIENNYEHFPGYGINTLAEYCKAIGESGQFKIIYNTLEEPIAFALWWILPSLEMCKEKSWEKPFPSNLNNGDFGYIDFLWILSDYKKLNLGRKLLKECHEKYPQKHVCFHRFTGQGLQKFYHRKPLNEKMLSE